MGATCIISNCRRRCPDDEPFCTEHRGAATDDGSREKLRRLEAMARSGTADSFMACDDETKRLVFALFVEESARRKEAEAALAECEAEKAPSQNQKLGGSTPPTKDEDSATGREAGR